MIPGMPPVYQVYKAGTVIDLNGQLQLQGPLAGAPTLESAHEAAKVLKLDRYLVVLAVGIFSNVQQPNPAANPSNLIAPNATKN